MGEPSVHQSPLTNILAWLLPTTRLPGFPVAIGVRLPYSSGGCAGFSPDFLAVIDNDGISLPPISIGGLV
jgi:hypothetical protein